MWTDDVKSGPDEGRWVNSQLTNVDSSVFPLDIMNLQPAKKSKTSALKCSYKSEANLKVNLFSEDNPFLIIGWELLAFSGEPSRADQRCWSGP